MKKNEVYISVDIETSGPIPSEFSLGLRNLKIQNNKKRSL